MFNPAILGQASEIKQNVVVNQRINPANPSEETDSFADIFSRQKEEAAELSKIADGEQPVAPADEVAEGPDATAETDEFQVDEPTVEEVRDGQPRTQDDQVIRAQDDQVIRSQDDQVIRTQDDQVIRADDVPEEMVVPGVVQAEPVVKEAVTGETNQSETALSARDLVQQGNTNTLNTDVSTAVAQAMVSTSENEAADSVFSAATVSSEPKSADIAGQAAAVTKPVEVIKTVADLPQAYQVRLGVPQAGEGAQQPGLGAQGTLLGARQAHQTQSELQAASNLKQELEQASKTRVKADDLGDAPVQIASKTGDTPVKIVPVSVPANGVAAPHAQTVQQAAADAGDVEAEKIKATVAAESAAVDPGTAVNRTQNTVGAFLVPPIQQASQTLRRVRAEADFRVNFEAVGISQMLAEASIRPTSLQNADSVRRIAVQLSEAFASKGERKVDVMLNPKELGRVNMQLATSEGGVKVVIHAERPETGDLMRRHIDELAKEFREMGFGSISFEFSSGDAQRQAGGQAEQSNGSQTETSSDADGGIAQQPVTQQLSLGTSGLDMRV